MLVPRLIVLVGGSETVPSGSVPLLIVEFFGLRILVRRRSDLKLSELSVGLILLVGACFLPRNV